MSYSKTLVGGPYNFNGTAGTELHSWNAALVEILAYASGSQAEINTGGTNAISRFGTGACGYKDGLTYSADHYVEFTIAGIPNGGAAGALLRASSTSGGSWYRLLLDDGGGASVTMTLIRRLTGSDSGLLDTQSITATDGDVFTVGIVGNTSIVIFKNGDFSAPYKTFTVDAVTDGLTGGVPAFCWVGANKLTLDDVSMGNLAIVTSGPVLSAPTATATGPTQATIGVTTDTAGVNLYHLVLPAATAAPADAATLIADGSAVSHAVSASGAQSYPITGLTTNTAVKVHFAQAGSNVVSSASFTPNTLAISGTALSAQTGTQGAALTWTGATPDSLITNHGNGSGSWSVTAGIGASGITGCNASTGVPAAATLGTPGSYTVTLTYTDGSTVPAAQTVTKTFGLTISAAGTAPSITVQPANQTVTAPATGSFSVTATGTSLTYQWQVSSDGGSTWANVSTGSGGTTSTYTTAATVLGDSGKKYRVIVTGDTSPAATSNGSSTLTVQTVPAVTTQPSNQSVTAAATATFTAVFSGSPTPTYQWQRSTDSGSTWANVSTGSGGTTAAYTTAATTISGGSANNGDRYRCTGTNAAGSATTNGAATLSVSSSGTAPSITVQPSNQAVVAPNTATFSVTATGTGLTYQWQLSTDSGSTWNNVSGGSGATTAAYTTAATTTGDTGNRYRVVVTGDTSPPATSNGSATLTVSAAPATSVTITLTSDGTTPRASLTGLKWAFFDQPTPDLFAAPTAKGNGESTNGAGQLVLDITGTALVPGNSGWLDVTDSDGTTAQAPPAKAFSGPVVVA